MTFLAIATSVTAVIAIVAAAILLAVLRKRTEALRAATAAKETIRAEYAAERDRFAAAILDARRLLDEAEIITERERAQSREYAESTSRAEVALRDMTARAEAAEQALREATAQKTAAEGASAPTDEEALRRLFAREMALRRSVTDAIELLMQASASPSAELLREEVGTCISSLNDALTKK